MATLEIPDWVLVVTASALREKANEFHGQIARGSKDPVLISEWRKRAEWLDAAYEQLKADDLRKPT